MQSEKKPQKSEGNLGGSELFHTGEKTRTQRVKNDTNEGTNNCRPFVLALDDPKISDPLEDKHKKDGEVSFQKRAVMELIRQRVDLSRCWVARRLVMITA